MNLITFFGADSKVGVTSVCQAVGEIFAEKYLDKKIALLHLDGQSGMEYAGIHYSKALDDLKAAIINEVLGKDELMNAFCIGKNKNLFQLPGIHNLSDRFEFFPKQVFYLLESLKEEFDLVLIDAGSNFEMGLTIGSLKAGETKGINILISTQQKIAYERYKNTYEQILSQMSLRFTGLVINKYISNNNLNGLEKWKEFYNQNENIHIIPYVAYGLQAEQEEIALHHLDKGYKDCIKDIVSTYAIRLGWDSSIEEKKNTVRRFEFWRGKKL